MAEHGAILASARQLEARFTLVVSDRHLEGSETFSSDKPR